MTCPIKGCPQPAHSALPWTMDRNKTLGNGVFSPVTYLDGHEGQGAVGTYQATALHGLAKDEEANARANGVLFAAAPDVAHALAELVEASERLAVEGRDCGYDTYIEIRTSLKTALMAVANKLEGRGELLHTVRFALSGLDKSPDPFIIASIIGKNETLSRLQNAI